MSFQEEVRATFRRGDSDAVLRLAEAERQRAQAAGDDANEVEAIYAMARVALRGDDLPRAEKLALEALEVAVKSGDRRLEERPRHVLAAVSRLAGDYVTARERYLKSIALNETLGQTETVNSEYHNLAFTELHLGHRDRARELFAEGRRRVFREGYRFFVPYLGVAAAVMASVDGEHQRAARMVGFTDSAYAALGKNRFAREYAAGAALTPEDAFGLRWEH